VVCLLGAFFTTNATKEKACIQSRRLNLTEDHEEGKRAHRGPEGGTCAQNTPWRPWKATRLWRKPKRRVWSGPKRECPGGPTGLETLEALEPLQNLETQEEGLQEALEEGGSELCPERGPGGTGRPGGPEGGPDGGSGCAQNEPHGGLLESLEALEEDDREALGCGQNEAVEALEGLKAMEECAQSEALAVLEGLKVLEEAEGGS
jgi:hypothetical protein